MKNVNLFARGATATAIAVLLSGCAGNSLETPPTATNAARALTAGHSWMGPDAKKDTLLYASDSAADVVNVFSYPRGKLVGTLTGFQTPQGMCVDKAGNVFITNSGLGEILEYAHGGTTPIATISNQRMAPNSVAYVGVQGGTQLAVIANS